jgi:hypothetical protein
MWADRWRDVAPGAGAFIAVMCVGLALRHSWLGTPAILLALLASLVRGFPAGPEGRAATAGLTLGVVALSGLRCVRLMHYNLTVLPEWDFMAFWMTGCVAAQGLDVYEPQNYQSLVDLVHPSREFVAEFVAVGSLYPPPTGLLFLPLGWLELRPAYLAWYAVSTGVLVAGIGLLWRAFLAGDGLLGLSFAAALTLLLPSTLANILWAQTSFLLLLCVALFWREQAGPRGGVWLAAGVLVKPFLSFLLLYLLLQRRWRVIAAFLATLLAVSLVSLVVFGTATWAHYLAARPASRLPPGYFGELGNGSLFALLWRITRGHPDHAAITQAAFAAAAACLTAVSCLLALRLGSDRANWALCLMLSLSLFLYPNAGSHYALALMPALLWLWSERRRTPGGAWVVIAFLVMLYALLGFGGGWSEVLVAAFGLSVAFFLGTAFLLAGQPATAGSG